MHKTEAIYFDGHTSAHKNVHLIISDDNRLVVEGLDPPEVLSGYDVNIQPRVGNTPRSVYLPNGAKLEIPDNDFVDEFVRRNKGNGVMHWVHVLESKWRYVALASMVTIAFAWWFVTFGIPSMAAHVAYSLPTKTDEMLGKGSLDTMDHVFFTPSQLPARKRQQLTTMFEDMVARANDAHHRYRLEFRKSKRIGANAFALPSGIVVVTDELIILAQNDQQIMAVLAHEIGHVVHRHGLRTVLQNSAISLIVAAIVGDITSVSSMAATFPTVLIHTKYSRQFETEADDYALGFMLKNNMNTAHFADIMSLMEKQHGSGELPAYLSSHPATQSRINKFKAASDQ
jgi:Zn-dependent protease with chaperone function